MYRKEDHTFVLCAYGENPYLRDTIRSLKEQSVKTKILAATSTMNRFIVSACEEEGIPLFENTGESGIAPDWNFAYGCADTKLVTIAHQDDIYGPDYTRRILQCANRAADPIFLFTDYEEIRGEKRVRENTLLRIKRIMLAPLANANSSSSVFIRKRILSFGNPICCPSVTYVKEKLPVAPFDTSMVNSMDYKLYADHAGDPGDFVYIPQILMAHRIYEESTTSQHIADKTRSAEDLKIMKQFWPDAAAKALHAVYVRGEKSNEVKEE